MTDNPLSQFYTQTGMYFGLPSNGRFYDTELTLSVDGELEVFPMNAIDELQFQNPDGLLNNESLIKVIERTCPGIPNANEIPKPDLDMILLAMRIITYGKNMDIETICSECKNKATYVMDLTKITASAKKIPMDNDIKLGDLTIYIKPYSLSSQNRLNEFMLIIQRTARQMQTAEFNEGSDNEMMDQMRKKMGHSVRDSALELFNIATTSIEKIILPNEDEVTDREFITEWLNNIKAPDYRIIREKIVYMSEEVIDRTFKFKCNECEHENKMEVNFDPANFFDLN